MPYRTATALTPKHANAPAFAKATRLPGVEAVASSWDTAYSRTPKE
ncbi:hypothetical protein LOC57_08745 [Arthrobacter sp. zg-Y750]|nr:hypothetical protein [Arthrobacter sp. zg-Y750]